MAVTLPERRNQRGDQLARLLGLLLREARAHVGPRVGEDAEGGGGVVVLEHRDVVVPQRQRRAGAHQVRVVAAGVVDVVSAIRGRCSLSEGRGARVRRLRVGTPLRSPT